jgi:uncharacterized protein
MAASENKELLKRVFAELATGNSRPLVECMAEDVRWTVSGSSRWSRSYLGKQAVLADLLRPLATMLSGRLRMTALNFIAEGDQVVVESRGEATTRAGEPYGNRYCWIFRVEDGRVRDITEYMDTLLVARVLEPLSAG